MSGPNTTMEETATGGIIVSPWGIEADHPRMSDLALQCAPGVRLRSSIDGQRPAMDKKSGEPRLPVDQSRAMGSFPKLPGMQIHVNPLDGTYKVIDPIHGNEQLCQRVEKYLRENTGLRTGATVRGVPPKEGKLDMHRMKSLCREMVWLVEAGEAKQIAGAKVRLDDVDKLPGHYLLNPGTRVGTTQPVYEKDFPAWVNNLSHSGG